MSTSRKILFAGLLLGGGYSLALLLGEITKPDWFPDMNSTAREAALPVTAQLAPLSPAPPHVSATATSPAVSPAPTTNWQPAEQPKWLAADPQQSATTTPAANPTPNSELAAPTLSPEGNPRARITSVTPSQSEPVAATSSPWDRWPPWDPNSTAAALPPVSASQASPPASSNVTPAQFHAATSPVVGAMQASFDQPNAPPAGATPLVGAPVRAATDPHELRTHIVIDGDSLSSLANRYLHDPQLGDEIFRLNRDVLTTPELLPIGVELKIPDNRVAVTTTIPGAPRGVDATNVSAPAPPRRLPEVTQDTAAAPRAQILRPVAAGSSTATGS